jgi:hypothetical protein
VKGAVGARFLEGGALISPRRRVCGRSIACCCGQIYITEIPDEIFLEKNRNEIIKFIVGRFPKNVE